MQKKIKVMHMIWSMGDGGAQQVVINYLRDFNNDPDIELKLYVYIKPTDSKYDKEIAEKGYDVVYLNNPRTKIQIPYIKRYFQRPVSRKTWDMQNGRLPPPKRSPNISPNISPISPPKSNPPNPPAPPPCSKAACPN